MSLRLSALCAALLFVFSSAPEASADEDSVRATLQRVLGQEGELRLTGQEAARLRLGDEVAALAIIASDEDTPQSADLAIWMLGEIRGTEACDALSALAPLEAPPRQMIRASALARCGDLSALRQMLAASQPLIRLKAAILLGMHGDVGALPLVRAMGESSDFAGMEALVAIARGLLGDEEAREALIPLLRIREMRDHAAIALIRLGHTSAVWDLSFACASDEAFMREVALATLVAARPPGGRNFLLQRIDDPDPRIAAWVERELRMWNHRRDNE